MTCSKKSTSGLIFGTVLATVLVFSGCSIQRTSRHYFPLVAHTYPAKPSTVQVPILDKPPKQHYLPIGKMNFETDNGMGFIYQSMQYNARKHGADAVILQTKPKPTDSEDVLVNALMIKY